MSFHRPIGCALALVLALLVAIGFLRLVSRALIYPGSPVPFPADLERRVPGARLVHYQAPGGPPLQGALILPGAPALVAVLFHGNGESAAQSLPFAADLADRGLGAFLVEYRGFGGLPGRPAEAHLYADGAAALDALRAAGIPPERTVLVGRSLGSGIAAELALRHPCARLVLISPYTSMTDMGRLAVGPLAPLVIPDRYDTLAKIARVPVPVVILHGARDKAIPVRMGRALAAAVPGARYVEIPNGDHNDLPGLAALLSREIGGR